MVQPANAAPIALCCCGLFGHRRRPIELHCAFVLRSCFGFVSKSHANLVHFALVSFRFFLSRLIDDAARGDVLVAAVVAASVASERTQLLFRGFKVRGMSAPPPACSRRSPLVIFSCCALVFFVVVVCVPAARGAAVASHTTSVVVAARDDQAYNPIH